MTLTKRSSQTASADASADAAKASIKSITRPERQTYERDAGAVNMIGRISLGGEAVRNMLEARASL